MFRNRHDERDSENTTLSRIITSDLAEMRKLLSSTSEAVVGLAASVRHFVDDSTRIHEEVDTLRKRQDELHAEKIPDRLYEVEKLAKELSDDRIARQSQWSGPQRMATIVGAFSTIVGGMILALVLLGQF